MAKKRAVRSIRDETRIVIYSTSAKIATSFSADICSSLMCQRPFTGNAARVHYSRISAQRLVIHKSILAHERDCGRLNLWKTAEDSITALNSRYSREIIRSLARIIDFILVHFLQEYPFIVFKLLENHNWWFSQKDANGRSLFLVNFNLILVLEISCSDEKHHCIF